MIFTSYRQQKVEGVFDTVVIGSGMGGLTVASLLARHAGKRVLILERHYTAGGFTHVFRRPGYEWDVGVHYIGQVNDLKSPVRAAYDYLTDGQLSWEPMPDVYDRLILGDREYEFLSDAQRFRARVLAGLGCSQELAGVLTGQWGDYGSPAGRSSFGVHALIAEHYFKGASYPIGGASAILASMLPAIERAGGKLLVSAEVEEIIVDDRGRAAGVRMQDGREIRAAQVISDAGAAANTYLRLLPRGVAQGLGVAQKLECIPASTAHLCLYVGLKHSSAELGLRGSNLWVCPTADHDANVARAEASPEQPLPFLFISFPAAKDPSFASSFPGRATIDVVAPAPFAWFEKWVDTPRVRIRRVQIAAG